jgi:hypothetical protein
MRCIADCRQRHSQIREIGGMRCNADYSPEENRSKEVDKRNCHHRRVSHHSRLKISLKEQRESKGGLNK